MPEVVKDKPAADEERDTPMGYNYNSEVDLNEQQYSNINDINAAANAYYLQLLNQLAKQNNPAVVRPHYRKSYKGPPVLRTGSQGASWRHIQQCVGTHGNNLLYIDGEMRLEAATFYKYLNIVLNTAANRRWLFIKLLNLDFSLR